MRAWARRWARRGPRPEEADRETVREVERLAALLVLGLGAAAPVARAAEARVAAAAPAPDRALPPGQLGEAVKLGKELFEQTGTHPLTKPYVRNALRCASCHPDSGAHPTAASLLGAATAYPAWSRRERSVITLEDRILNCFMRSMDGVRPPNGSKPSVALAAYLTWLSTGQPVRMNPSGPTGPRAPRRLDVDPDAVSLAHGARVYRERCALCHGEDGQGPPPLWGPRSFNAGAGLADVAKLASWVKVTMPPDDPDLSERDAADVAAFVNSKPRHDFVLKEHLPPPQQAVAYDPAVLDEVVRAPTWPPRDD